VATTLATERPEHVRLAKDLLGHAGFGTTEQYYLHAGSIIAGRAYQEVLKRARSGS
jgi:integrase